MKIRAYETDAGNSRYWQEKEILGNNNMGCLVNVFRDFRYQTVKGFGGAFTESSAYNLFGMSKEKQQEMIDAYFGAEGLKYNLCRTHIASCDFALGNYAYASTPGLSDFSVEHDEQYIIPMIKMAKSAAGDEIILLASPWSPPAYMKTNNDMNHGGKLKPEYLDEYAEYLVKYIRAYEAEGIKVSMISVQNEPQAVQTWDSCIYDTEEEMLFVRDHLGPALEKNGLKDVKILVWDHNKEILFERADGILQDAKAAEYVGGVAFHWYSGDHFEQIAMVHEKYPDKELYFTEGCVEYYRFADSNEVYKAEMYAHDILGDLLYGANGYMDWNLFLDEKGGPNHVNNFCAAPIMCNKADDTYEKRLSYYYIGHFSRYIARGAKRLGISRYNTNIEAVAFENPDKSIVLVLLNRTENDIYTSVRLVGEDDVRSISLKAHSICTVLLNSEE